MKILQFIPAVPILLADFVFGAYSQDFIRQIQVVNGAQVVSDMTASNSDGQTNASGQVTSSGIEAKTAVFQLWCAYTNSGNTTSIIKLDEESVGTFLPVVSITTTSEDPFVPTCTRADRPYSVQINVSGMLNGASDPDYSKSVLLNRGYKVFSPVTYSPTGVTGEYSGQQTVHANGSFTSTFYQTLPSATPTTAVGAETFSAWIQPSAQSTMGQLAAAEVIVWPVATATISGIETIEKHLGLPQSATITLVNAYPRSTTYAQIYPGPAVLGTTGLLIPNSVKTYGSGAETPNTPQNTTISTLSLEPLSEQLATDGIYTIEVLTTTPFNNGAPERLDYVTFEMKRTLQLNTVMTDME